VESKTGKDFMATEYQAGKAAQAFRGCNVEFKLLAADRGCVQRTSCSISLISALRPGFAAAALLSDSDTNCGVQMRSAYFARNVNSVVSFNGCPGLTTMEGKFL
jgi:hypothetical protein